MEFYRTVNKPTSEGQIAKLFRLEYLERWTSFLVELEPALEEQIQIGGIWGEFTLERQLIKGGVRFSLKECPNALTWTMTTGNPKTDVKLRIHLTINRTLACEEFASEIEEFLDELKINSESLLKPKRLKVIGH